MFTTNTPYSWERDLYDELGLEQFNVGLREEVNVGKVELDSGASVTIFVSCYPAQFFRAFIITDSKMCYEVKTGSGDLTTYWPMFKAIAENMLVVRKAEL